MLGTGELRAAPRLHQIDEGPVDVLLDRLQPRHVFGILRQKRVEHRFVGARGVDAALDADLVDQLGESE